MRLLLDHNLSRKIKGKLPEDFGIVAHVVDFGLERASDLQVWQFAREHDFCIISKDKDFLDLSDYYGHPPKFTAVRIGNCTTADICEVLIKRREDIADFLNDDILSAMLLTR
jgi:predicted nuclease of predicted toxin-antitoxin system